MAKWTGERLETHVFSENTIEHLHRYGTAIQLAKGKTVLDIASGEGYGANLLSSVALKVIGVDISVDAVEKARGKYQKGNLEFVVGSADKIPLPNKSIDLVVSFETLEHHDKHQEMFLEMKRVLKDNGTLIISSPNKLNYSDRRNYNNPFHVKELYEGDFKALVYNYFRIAKFFHQQTFYGSLLLAEDESSSRNFCEYVGDFDRIMRDDGFTSYYIVAVASDCGLPSLDSSLFKDSVVIKTMIDSVKKSRSYQLGYVLLAPFRLIKRTFFDSLIK